MNISVSDYTGKGSVRRGIISVAVLMYVKKREGAGIYTNLNPECICLVRNILKDAIDIFTKAGKAF